MIPNLSDATCRSFDPDIWFADDPLTTGQAIALCNACPVRAACFAAANDCDGTRPYGVWGGYTSEERKALRDPNAVRRPGLSSAERRSVQARALSLTREGLSAREVAIRLGFDRRTVERWVAASRTAA